MKENTFPEDATIHLRWGIPEWDTDPFTRVPMLFLQQYSSIGISNTEAVLLVQLASFNYASDHSVSAPSIETLASRLGLSPRQVQRLIKSLVEKGLKVIERSGKTNIYDLSRISSQIVATATHDIDVVPTSRPTSRPLTPMSPLPLTPMSPEEEYVQEEEDKKNTAMSTADAVDGALSPAFASSTLSDDAEKALFDFYCEQIKPLRVWNRPRRSMLEARLKSWTFKELRRVILNIRASPFHMGDNDRGRPYNDFELLFRNDAQVEKYLNLESVDPLKAWLAKEDSDGA